MDTDMRSRLETKATIPTEALVTHGELVHTFEAFKQTNDERLITLERRSGDVLLEEKVARIDGALDAHQKAHRRITVKHAQSAIGYDGVARSLHIG